MACNGVKAFVEEAEILENRMLAEDYYILRVKSPKTAEVALAGQFSMLKPKNEIRILRRPISIHSVDKEKGEMEYYYEVLGGGTKDFATLKTGETINIQGPLGVGFDLNIENKNVVAIGGGLGIAPLKELLNQLKDKNKVVHIAGGRSAKHLGILSNFDESIETLMATDDGSLGQKGNTVDILKEYLKENKVDIIYTCGPHVMMEAVARVAREHSIRCQVSLEERMACGVKACMGCSIPTTKGMQKVCYDGPVFEADEVIDVE